MAPASFRRYADRIDAGHRLGELLGPLSDPLVLGLPRGGVVVAHEVARATRGALDVVVVRKLGAPHHPEYGIGALAEDDEPLWDEHAVAALGLTEGDREHLLRKERDELVRRRELYRSGPLPAMAGRLVVVVDDGLATGVTARAALRRVRREVPSRVVLAVPVGAPDTVRALARECDEVVCPHQPPDLASVGAYYDDFEETSDREVISLLSP
jgi:predicted phosphoribosyltransferase